LHIIIHYSTYSPRSCYIGWCNWKHNAARDSGTTLGDDVDSYGYNPKENGKWSHGESDVYGPDTTWNTGDVIGVCIQVRAV
jgi:hypothetical protein